MCGLEVHIKSVVTRHMAVVELQTPTFQLSVRMCVCEGVRVCEGVCVCVCACVFEGSRCVIV